MPLAGKHILLGITGGIAAYKTPELVRQLTSRGAVVQVVLTHSAAKFVTPTTLQAVSGRTVRDDLWDAGAEAAMGHIELARWAHCILVAPATAHSLARLANGLADDLLTAICLAATCPIAAAPAMNHQMWKHAATRRNLARLESDGIRILGPDDGPQACGEFGPGRMLEPETLCAEISKLFGPRPLTGKRVIVTAGPTREPIDPVRYISNHSSGKQGFAIAEAARDAGADVTLISGPVGLATPTGVTRINVTTGQQMHDAVAARLDACDLFIGVAAVADYRPAHAHSQKIKKSSDAGMSLDLVQNPDIIATVAARKTRPFVVGFAAETENTTANARAKLTRKRLDMIVLNDVSDRRIGFNSDDNAVTVITSNDERRIEIGSKADISRALIEHIAAAIAGQVATRRTDHPKQANESGSASG
jgi:phosphopantothenoylcysteine decarboxylase/phosphopantothenate--cysteine ligase